MTDSTVIITGHVVVAASERAAYVERMQDLVERARRTDGCVHLAVTADPLDPRRVNNAEVWRDRAALTAWRPQARAPEQPDFDEIEVGFYEARAVDPM